MNFARTLFGLALGPLVGCGFLQDQPDGLSAHDAKLIQTSDRTVSFANIEWKIRGGDEPTGAGPNLWGARKESVEVVDNVLHLRIRNFNGTWRSAEIMTPIPDAYRGAILTINSPLHDLDPNVVVSMFAYRDDRNEADIEFSRWGGETTTNAQYVVHTPTTQVGPHRFSIPQSDPPTTIHTLTWGGRVSPAMTPGREPISFSSVGAGGREEWEAIDASPNFQRAWLHVNVWLLNGAPPARGQDVDIEIGSIRFY